MFEFNDFRFDRGREAALTAINIENPLHVCLRTRLCEHGARLQLNFAAKRRGIDFAVTLEGNLIDDGVLDDGHDDCRSLRIDRDVGEKAGCEQRLERRIDLGGVISFAGTKLQVRTNSLRFDTPIAGDLNVLGDALSVRLAGKTRHSPNCEYRSGQCQRHNEAQQARTKKCKLLHPWSCPRLPPTPIKVTSVGGGMAPKTIA